MAEAEEEKKRPERPRRAAAPGKRAEPVAVDALASGEAESKLVPMLALLAMLIGLGYFAWNVYHAQDVSDIARGRTADVAGRLAHAREQGDAVQIGEGELNGFIASTLETKDSGLGKVRRVLVRLKPQVAEVVIERELFGMTQTVSVFVRMEPSTENPGALDVSLDGGRMLGILPAGGRFGQLRMPQGFVRLVLGSFENLAAVYKPEFELLGLSRDSKSNRPRPKIAIAEGSLTVDYGG